jgi:hypothetical protein
VFIVSPPTRLAILAELIDTDNVLDALTCALFQSSFIPATNTTLAELEAAEADDDATAILRAEAKLSLVDKTS